MLLPNTSIPFSLNLLPHLCSSGFYSHFLLSLLLFRVQCSSQAALKESCDLPESLWVMETEQPIKLGWRPWALHVHMTTENCTDGAQPCPLSQHQRRRAEHAVSSPAEHQKHRLVVVVSKPHLALEGGRQAIITARACCVPGTVWGASHIVTYCVPTSW